jgi:pyruvate/2-oxoglutarate dehydrogenase complex dihydrolipoamide acyltransferase (E2) component
MIVSEISVPSWGLEMEEATFTGWLKQVGESIEKGEPICSIETDKAAGEVEAEVSGRLIEVVAAPGDVVNPGDVLGRIEVDG